MKVLLRCLVLLAVALISAPAAACPDCAIGRQARARFWDQPSSWRCLAGISLPLAVPVAIGAFLQRPQRTQQTAPGGKERT